MFAQETIFIGVQVYKPSCTCKLFEERRHFRGGFWPWEQCWGPWMVGRWRSGSFGFGLLYWSYDLWRLQGQVQRKMRAAVLWDYETVYSFTSLFFSTNSGQKAKAWLSSGSLVWSFSLEPFSPAGTEKRSQLYFQAYLQLPFLISTTESPDRLVNRRTGFSFFFSTFTRTWDLDSGFHMVQDKMNVYLGERCPPYQSENKESSYERYSSNENVQNSHFWKLKQKYQNISIVQML